MSFVNWIGQVIQEGLLGSVGGSALIIGILCLVALGFMLYKLNASLPVALLISVFAIGVLSETLNSAGFLSENDIGLMRMMYLVLLVGGGILTWSLLFRRSGASG